MGNQIRFGTLYAGHVDLEDIGFAGEPVNDRWLPNEKLISVFSKAEAIAKTLDKVGFSNLWLAEHHFQREGYECIPNILMLALHLSHVTKKIRLGCGFNIAPMWHPLRLAEDYATADILTNGRVIFGVGRGYHSREVEGFGSPQQDQKANRELFEDQIEIILKAFNEESFSHHSEFYDIPPQVPYRDYILEDLTLVPRPVNRPIEVWQPIVSGSSRALEFMGKHGIRGLVPAAGAGDKDLNQVAELYLDTMLKFGHELELGQNLLVSYNFHIAANEYEAKQEVRKYFEESMKLFAPLGFYRGFSDFQIQQLNDPTKAPLADLPSLEQSIESGTWLCGSADSIAEKILALRKRIPGIVNINVSNSIGTSESVITEQLQRFGEEVIPMVNG